MINVIDGKSRDFGFVGFRNEEEAQEAMKCFNNSFFDTRPINCEVENIARTLGVSKSEFLDEEDEEDEEDEDLAVRTVLGETQVIAETKKALAKVWVNITSLEEFVAKKSNHLKRSSHVILVKNLPYGSSVSELAAMFGRFGSLDKIILLPTKTLALIIFLEPSDARASFFGLRYKRYKDFPLYLEWAPSNILAEDATNKIVGEEEVKKVLLEQEVDGMMDPDIDHDRIEGTVLDGHALMLQLCHVKDKQAAKKVENDKSSTKLIVWNVPFEATEKDLRMLFSPFGQIIRLELPMRIGNHSGFAFVEFVTKQEAQNAFQALSNVHLYARHLVLERVEEGESLEEPCERTSSKVLINRISYLRL